jgi:peptidoglycan/LPS O-acetylase OafA/YrhL
MHPTTSVYLDAVRFIASMLVFTYHLTSWKIFGFGFHLSTDLGQNAVLVFFVLSGYVIAYVTDAKERDPRTYLVSRFARLYSVCIPALLLTLVLDSAGMSLDPEIYDANAHSQTVVRLFTSFLFLNQIWNFTITPLSNGAYWSVAFEFWYYMIFAAAVFLRGGKRLTLVILLLAFVGPRILILLPMWLLGVWIYHIQKKNALDGRLWAALFPISLLAFLWLLPGDGPAHGLVAEMKGKFADGYIDLAGIPIFIRPIMSFPADYLFAATFALTIVSSHAFFSRFKRQESLIRLIRLCASYTFSLYLFHIPLLSFYRALLNHDPNSLISFSALVIATLGSVVVLGWYTEHKKDWLHNLIDRGIDRYLTPTEGTSKIVAESRRSG